MLCQRMGYIEGMLSALRIVWICLLVLALPVQGMAAATMAFCSQAGHHAPTVSAHNTHGMHHGADADTNSKMPVTATPVTATPVTADMAQPNAHEAGHTCSACASCCAAAFIPAAGSKMVAINMAATLPTAALVGIGPFATDAPERPPRVVLA